MSNESVSIVRHEECPFTGNVTVFLSNNTAQTFDRESYRLGGFRAWADAMSLVPSTDRVDVIQYGRKVGELPAFWTPMLAKSQSALFDYRPGDLTLRDGKWYAHPSLGARDLDCLVGFVRKDAPETGLENIRVTD